MTNNQLDEDSLQQTSNLFKSDKRQNGFNIKSILSETIEYSTSLKEYFSDKLYSFKRFSTVHSLLILKNINEVKTYAVTKLFWGRGSIYRYIVLLSVFLPIAASVFIIYTNRAQVPQKKNLTLTNAVINQAAKNAAANDGKVVETNSTVTQNAQAQGLISWYTVTKGDTLQTIAQKFNISTDSIVWANNLSSDNVTPGQQLNILPVPGIIYTTKENDTLKSIGNYYQVDPMQIAVWNTYVFPNVSTDQPLPGGKKILVPGATDPLAIQHQAAVQFALTAASPSAGCGNSWCFLQNDPRWGGVRLGDAYSAYQDLANIGCLVTDVAMVAEYYSDVTHVHFTPKIIAENPYYFDGGSGLFTLSGLGYFNVSPLGGLWGSVDWSQIDAELALKRPVIVGFAYANHYVVVYQKVGNDYMINDPAYGTIKLSSRYIARYASQAYLYTPIAK